MHRTAASPPWRRLVVAACCAAVLLTGCSWDGTLPTPDPTDDPGRAAAELAAGLAKRDLTMVEFSGAAGSAVNAEFQPLVSGMARLKPSVDVTGVDVQGDAATASLNFSWTFPGVATRWTYRSTAAVRREDGRWRSSWAPGVLHPQLDGSNRLSQRRINAPRGEMLGDRGEAIMIPRPVVRIGIDKTEVKAEQLTSSATRLARLVDIDARRYVKEVAEAGPEAFVAAIVLRASDDDRPENSAVLAIPGALPLEGEQVLAPTREFARPIVGTVGDASKEIVDSSGGAVVSGDQVGLSGLQRRYDVPLRGTPGVQVRLLPPKPTPSASPSASPSPTRSASPSASPSAGEPVTVFEAKPVAGKDLTITL
ncbi:MAG TPA: NTF2-like N-terminal transpeptidase domain-containing protein, partial [Microlunatus sp.]